MKVLSMATYRVLAIDGGGIRGLVTTIVLQKLVAEPGFRSVCIVVAFEKCIYFLTQIFIAGIEFIKDLPTV